MDLQRSPEALFGAGVISQYLGAACAVWLFDSVAPEGVAWLRVFAAAVILIVARRSWRGTWTRSSLGWAAAFGIVLASMNLSIYFAIDKLPLGTATAIEFVGPIVVAALGSRTKRNAVAVALAAGGVVLLAEVQPEGSTAGVWWALLAGALWAGYIVLGHRVATTGAAIDGLGIGMAFGAAAIAVFGVGEIGPAFDRPWLLVVVLATALLSNVIPYGIDQLVMQRLDRNYFALLQTLGPVVGAIVGLVFLGQRLSGWEVAGIGLVVAALLVRRDPKTATPRGQTP